MKIDFGSVIKAGGIAAAAAIVLGIITEIPFVGSLLWLCLCIGGFLIPIGAGMAYGYFSPGDEEIGESAIGGLLAGGTAGILYGIIRGLAVAVFAVIDSSDVVGAVSASVITIVGSVCGSAIGGIIFGAIGGLIWYFVQQRRGPEKV